MRKLALQVEHKYKNRTVGVHIVDGRRQTATIGSSRGVDIRVVGEDISGIHAAFERTGETWSVSDLGSGSGTWINKKPVIEQIIEGATVIHIGNHTLRATPTVIDRDLFSKTSGEAVGAFTYHQVAIFKKGLLQRSIMLPKGQAFTSEIPGFAKTFAAPETFEWTTTEFEQWTVKQRLTKSDVVIGSGNEELIASWKRPGPMVAALMTLLMVFGVMFLMPDKPDEDVKTLTPELQNQYTRLILDGQKVRQKKMVAEKLRKKIEGQSQQGIAKSDPGGDNGSVKPAANNKQLPGAKVVMNLKNAGLGALIGKISARASKTAKLIETAGVSPDSAHSGRALGIGGGSSLDKLGGGGGGGGQGSQKIAGIGTAGKGGGSTGFKGTGALSLGNIGNAEVGVLEEETEIDGGLDKEAIARVIRSQLGQIRYCYERQLSASPDLYGKILVKFTIGAAGAVVAQAIGNTSLNNAMVEGCILRRIAEWQFPLPRGGTNVLVTYPFLFKSTR